MSVKISQLPSGSTSFTDTETGIVVQEGVTKKYEISRLAFTGEIKANDTPTNGFTSGFLLSSDGSKVTATNPAGFADATKLTQIQAYYDSLDEKYITTIGGIGGLSSSGVYLRLWDSTNAKYQTVYFNDNYLDFGSIDINAKSFIGSVTIPIATTKVLGGIKIGASLRQVAGLGQAGGPITAIDGTSAIDLSVTNRFELTLDQNRTLSLSNVPTGCAFSLKVRGSAYLITWWSNIKWSGGLMPVLPTNSSHWLSLAFELMADNLTWLGHIGSTHS